MTAQFSDRIAYRGHDYSIAGKNGQGLFDPGEHGLKPVGKCSACWRGFVCAYSVSGQLLLLDRLAVYVDEPAPPLLGTEPNMDERRVGFFDVVYENINHPVPYSGGLLLARGFIKELYVHMGFHPAWKYREVHELVFRNGEVVQEADRSKQIAAFRREVADRPVKPGFDAKRPEVGQWIKQCFSQDYRW